MRHTDIALAAVAAALLSTTAANAAAYKTVHAFCTTIDCPDGQNPRAGLTPDGHGNWYGTTTGGGIGHGGTIYRLSFNGTRWIQTVLHAFCSQANCQDGNFPQGGVVVAADGALWGTTTAGGAEDKGVIWKLTPNGKKWTIKNVHSFCIREICTDGSQPLYGTLAYQGQDSGALYDGTSPLYGTANAGGAFGEGTLFSFTPNGTRGAFKTVHDFCKDSGCPDGAEPAMGVAVDTRGHLFGATSMGGIGGGVVYEVIPNGARWTFKVAHTFCDHFDGMVCADGVAAIAPPVIDDQGNLYGTASGGGSNIDDAGAGPGTVYKLTPKGNGYKVSTLHDFCGEKNCTDGKLPGARLLMGADGSLYGTTFQGGSVKDEAGILFKLGGPHLTTFTNLHAFTVKAGAMQIGTLAFGPDGSLLGALAEGGMNGGGAIYRYTP